MSDERERARHSRATSALANLLRSTYDDRLDDDHCDRMRSWVLDVKDSYEAALADRDRQIAALREEIEVLEGVAMVADIALGDNDRLRSIEQDRAAIEAEVVEQVAMWLEHRGVMEHKIARAIAEEVRSGAWRKR